MVAMARAPGGPSVSSGGLGRGGAGWGGITRAGVKCDGVLI